MSKLQKSYELSDVKITFVSLVDRAANKKTFLLTKQEDGKAGFQSGGRIIKADGEGHLVTGIVYEPMVADAHDNFMTEAEIEKAAHWFMKNGDKVDIQHSFQQADGLTVVESSVTKADQTIEGVAVKKGTWIMTIEVANDAVWEAIQKGALTGFSMGGIGIFNDDDVDLEDDSKVEKADSVPEKLNLLERIARAMGIESAVIKGEMRDKYEKATRFQNFWTAFEMLNGVLCKPDPWTGEPLLESDGEKIQYALQEFCDIITELLATSKADELVELRKAKPKSETEPVEKAGKKMSQANRDRLNDIARQLMDFAKEFEDEPDAAQAEDDASPSDADNTAEQEGESDVSREEIQNMIDEAITKALAKPEEQQPEQPEVVEVEKKEELTTETVQNMIDASVEKAAEAENKLDEATVAEMIRKALAEAFKQRGLASNLEDGNAEVQKSEPVHYLHGIL